MINSLYLLIIRIHIYIKGSITAKAIQPHITALFLEILSNKNQVTEKNSFGVTPIFTAYHSFSHTSLSGSRDPCCIPVMRVRTRLKSMAFMCSQHISSQYVRLDTVGLFKQANVAFTTLSVHGTHQPADMTGKKQIHVNRPI